MALLPLYLLTPILFLVAFFDLRLMRIPNALVVAAIVLFVVTAPVLPMAEIGWRILAATIVFGIGFLLFALRLFGGGDIKMLSSLLLFIPSQTLALFGVVFSAAMIIGICFVLLVRSLPLNFGKNWQFLQSTGTFPMGISIALSGVLHIWVVTALA